MTIEDTKVYPKNTEEKVTEVIGGSADNFIIRQPAQLVIQFIYVVCFKYFKEIKGFKEIRYMVRICQCRDEKSELVSDYRQRTKHDDSGSELPVRSSCAFGNRLFLAYRRSAPFYL